MEHAADYQNRHLSTLPADQLLLRASGRRRMNRNLVLSPRGTGRAQFARLTREHGTRPRGRPVGGANFGPSSARRGRRRVDSRASLIPPNLRTGEVPAWFQAAETVATEAGSASRSTSNGRSYGYSKRNGHFAPPCSKRCCVQVEPRGNHPGPSRNRQCWRIPLPELDPNPSLRVVTSPARR